MTRSNRIVILILAITLFLMITYSAWLSAAIYEGIILCLRVIIPSLFPFFVICTYLNSMICQFDFKFLRHVGRFCGIPQGSEAIMLMGILGGYPIGAQCVAQAYENKVLTKYDAEHMLGFCNNAGPAFIFGILAMLFPEKYILWIIWLIQIVSSIITAHILTKGNPPKPGVSLKAKQITFKEAMEKSTGAIIAVCSWVVLFKVIVTAANTLLNSAQTWIAVVISGMIELANGCYALSSINSVSLRFILATSLLSFGGICVHMQTFSVTGNLRKHLYIKGKFLQTVISIALSCVIQTIVAALTL